MKVKTKEIRRKTKSALWRRIRKSAIKGRRSLSMETPTGKLKRL